MNPTFPSVTAAVRSILRRVRPSPRSTMLLLSGAGLVEGLSAPLPAEATTIAGLTGRTEVAITSMPSARPVGASSRAESGHKTSSPSQSQRDFSAALAQIQAQLAAQAAASAAAQAGPSSIPDGLTTGGLQVATGLTWQGANNPVQAQSNGSVNVEIDQTAAQAILNWSTFNVGKNTTVYYNQKAGTKADGGNTWVALNRVNDPSGVPSQILGQIKAEGSVYVVNHNGVIFGGTSQVDVHSLVASSLDISDTQFSAGIVDQTVTTGVVSSSVATPVAPVFANSSGQAADIVVRPGAVIQTKAPTSVTTGGGTIMLLGGNVDNAGSLLAPDGQVLLAAGTSAYLYDSFDSSIRGAMVNVLNGGTVTNEAPGYVSAPTGNITLAGMSLRQNGVVAASTSINEAGSIILSAGDGLRIEASQVNYSGPYNYSPHATHAGSVTLSPGSLTTVLPEEDGLKALDGQPQGQSLVRLEGETVDLLGGATLLAPGAKVQLNASSDPLNFYATDYPTPGLTANFGSDAGRIYAADGATIDVAGMKGVVVDASEDVVQVNVRGNELRDDLAQQGGILTGSKVWVNIHDLLRIAPDRIYTAGGLIEVSGWLGLTQRSVDERLTAGGSVNIMSTGDAILRPGSSIDISGGSIQHQGGYVDHTLLLGADGRAYDINDAPADVQYVSIGSTINETDPRWNVTSSFANGLLSQKIYDPGYIEGKSAGTLSINSNALEFDSHVDASTVAGPYQRTAGSVPHNGTLTIGATNIGNILFEPVVAPVADVFAGSSVTGLFPEDPTPGQRVRDPSTQLPSDRRQTLLLAAGIFNAAQFGAVDINSDEFSIAAGANLSLAPGGALTIHALGGILVDGAITVRGGKVALTTGIAGAPSSAQSTDVELKPGSVIDTRGLWINDAQSPGEATPLFYNGGSVTIQAQGNLLLDRGSLIDASSGGWVQQNGRFKSVGGVPVGTGGDITLEPDANRGLGPQWSETVGPDGQTLMYTNAPQTYPNQAVLDGTLRSGGFTRGGTLSLTEPQIVIGGSGSGAAGALVLDPSFFLAGGFSRYQLYGFQGVTVAPGTDIELPGRAFEPSQSLLSVPTGGDFAAVTSIGPVPSLLRPQPVDLVLSAVDAFAGDVNVGRGAVINADPGATVAFHAQHDLYFDGTVKAPGGNIYLDLYGSPLPASSIAEQNIQVYTLHGSPGYDPSQTLWMGSDSRLLAPGYIANYGDPVAGAVTPVVHRGGSVNINTDVLDAAYYPDLWTEQVGAMPLGTVVAERGAMVDVSGSAGSILVPRSGLSQGFSPVPVVSAGGSVTIDASMGLLWAGTIDAHGGGPAAAGGSLTVDQRAYAVQAYQTPGYTQPVFELVLSQHALPLPQALAYGGAVPASLAGQLNFSADQIQDSGFENVSVGAVDVLAFNGDVNLHVADSLKVNANNLSATPGASVTLTAPYVDIGGGQRISGLQNAASGDSSQALAVAGTANLAVRGGLIDIEERLLSGAGYTYTSAYTYNSSGLNAQTTTVSMPGFANMNFESSGDIRLANEGNASPGGWLLTQGNLNFKGAQVYPTTGDGQGYRAFVIQASGADSVVTFARASGAIPDVPLAAAAKLQIIAPEIDQGGILRAPMGQIIFGDPTNPTYSNVTLLPGSLTSVSAEGALIPWGQPLGTTGWNYGYQSNGAPQSNLTAPLAKKVGFYGNSVDVKSGALLDESGGGDLYGAQFVPGRSGSADVLSGSQTFAVLPSLGAAPAPRDLQLQRSDGGGWTDSTPVALKAGDEVYLSSMPGLAAGYYTLLPGHYALLPGGFRVTVSQAGVVPGDGVPNQALPGGSYLVSGYLADANTGRRDQLASQFLVTPGSVVRGQAQYDESTIGTFFAAQAASASLAPPQLPADAGSLVIQAATSLAFQGTGKFAVGTGGRGGQADIVGTNLYIAGSSANDTAPQGAISLSDSTLNNIGAQSLLIGGTRSVSGNTVVVTPVTQSLELAGDAELKAPEIMLVASNTVALDPGAVLDTTGFSALPDAFPNDPLTGATLGRISIAGGSGAFLMGSNANPLPVTWATPGASAGVLTLGAGAGIYAKGNLVVSPTGTASVAPTAHLASPTIEVASDVINLGDGGTGGFTLNQGILDTIAHGDQARGVGPTSTLILNASTSIDTYGAAALGAFDSVTGSYSLQNLILSAPLIQGAGASGDTARITADRITMQNPATAGSGSASGAGVLEMDTSQLTLGPGIVSVTGFQATHINASQSVTSIGAGTFNIAGDLKISSPLLTGMAKADTTLNATGSVLLDRPISDAGGAEGVSAGLGAHLSVTGSSVLENTDLEFASGAINLIGSNVTIGTGAVIDVAGALVPMFDVVRITPAGSIGMTAQSGNVTVAAGAMLDLSGGDLAKLDRTKTPSVDPLSSDKGSDAGTLRMVATAGSVQLNGVLKGGTVAGYNGGTASLNIGSGDATSLLGAIATFTGEQDLTLAAGDINVGSISAKNVNLSASKGNISVTGLIDASGANGGEIRLTAGRNLTLLSTARLDAHASGTNGEGGDVFLGLDGLSTGTLTLASGSSVDVSGSGKGGRLILRAPQVGTAGIAIAPVSGVTIAGARDLTVEAVAVTDITANPFVDQALPAADAAASAYMANAGAIESSLGSIASNPAFHFQPGIELRSSGDMTLLQSPTPTTDGIDLHTYRYNGEPMALTLRAAGNLNINGSLSDGFDTPVTVGNDPVTGQSSGAVYAIAPLLPAGSPSATIRLVAGANLAGADPLALEPLAALPVGEGSINLNAPQLDQGGYPIPSVVRTGTGELTLAAGRDITFLSQFGVYTAGTPSAPVPGFTDPTRVQITNDPNNFFGPQPSYFGYFMNPDGTWAPGYDTVYPTTLQPAYPTGGGKLTVTAQGNLSSTQLSEPNGNSVYTASEPDLFWLWTQWTGANQFDQATWFINFGTYYQSFAPSVPFGFNIPVAGAPSVAAFVGLGALGGGSAKVSVGGNLTNVDVAVPTTGRIPTGTPDLGRAVISGGGNLTLNVGDAIDGGNLVVANGLAKVRATDIGPNTLVDLVAGDDGRFNVYSDRNLNAMIGDMTRAADQVSVNLAPGQTFTPLALGLEGILPELGINPPYPPQAPYGYFTSYTAGTAVDLRSGGGDITLNGDFVPAVFDVTADTGSVLGGNRVSAYAGPIALFAIPEPDSQIDLLAGRDVQIGLSASGMVPPFGEGPIQYLYPGTVADFHSAIAGNLLSPTASNLVQPNDSGTDHIYALNGNIVNPLLVTTKQTQIRAGSDINSPVFFLQNNHEGDVSVIEAGRDITSCEPATLCGVGYVFDMQIGGPGHLVVQAGRDLLLQSDMTPQNYLPVLGIASVGNAYNANLPTSGASLTINVGVGAGPRNSAFIDAYIDPATAGSTSAPYVTELLDYMQKRTGKNLSVADAVAVFRALEPEQQAPLIQAVYFAEIKAGGRIAAAGLGAGGKGFDRSYKAIQTLFPGSQIGQPTTDYNGDLSMYGYGKIRTEAGGDIGIVVPGGDITLGFENQTPNLVGDPDTAKPGVLTLRGGDINIVSDGSQIVAQSRVFTELGGDIMMWSTNGDVNAGKGKKTSIVTSPPQLTYDPDGNVTKSPVTPQTGAGIATLIGVPGVKPGDVDLFAPHGTVDAGDAGIRVSGNIFIAAQQVANADNIQIQGKSFGLPPRPVPDLALTTASKAATDAAALLKPAMTQEARTTVTVEVTGFGGDDHSCANATTRSSECPQSGDLR